MTLSIKDILAQRKYNDDIAAAAAAQDLAAQNQAMAKASYATMSAMMGDTFNELEPYISGIGHQEDAGKWSVVKYIVASDELELAPITITVTYAGRTDAEVYDRTRRHWSHLTPKDWLEVLYAAHLAYPSHVATKRRESEDAARAKAKAEERAAIEAAEKAEYAAKRAAETAAIEQFIEAVRQWWRIAQPIQEANIAALNAYATELNQPYTTQRIHYGVIANEDSAICAQSKSINTLGVEDDYRLCIVGSAVIRRHYTHLVATEKPITMLPADDDNYERCIVHIYDPSQYIHHRFSLKLYAAPGSDRAEIEKTAYARLTALPTKPAWPDILSVWDANKIYDDVTGSDESHPF